MKAKTQQYIKNIESGILKSRAEQVLFAIKKVSDEGRVISMHDLRPILRMPHQTLAGRISELNDEGIIDVVTTKQINGKIYSYYTFIYDLESRKLVAERRHKERLNKWLKQGLNEFSEYITSITFADGIEIIKDPE